MLDIREKAADKAKTHIEARAEVSNSRGTGFESERQKAKNALRNEMNIYDGSGVQKISASSTESDNRKILNVAAYCRVSTDDIDQIISIEMQKKNYREYIKTNPQWKFCGLYVDDGFSGTNTFNRPGFQRMMKDALSGKIDLIITKSVSRFARNLIDCISWVRRLKEHDPPIPVFFEQENLNTVDSTSNIILFVLAMVAEEESHMKSEAMLLSLEWRFSRGRFMVPELLGYDKVEIVENGVHRKQLVINEDQAQTVRLMYYMLLNGSAPWEIAETLTGLGRETRGRTKDGKPNTCWTSSTVTSVLRNERYCGDVLARKTWTPDFHTHKSIKNRNKKNKYYQPDHHDAIVTRAQWNAAQRILNSHRYGYEGTYSAMRVIKSGALKGFISVNRRWAGNEKNDYYSISRIAMGLDEGELISDLENTHLPEGGHSMSGLLDDNGIHRISRELSEMEKVVKAQIEGVKTDDKKHEDKTSLKKGFQVVGNSMFSQKMEPVIRISKNSIYISSVCVKKFSTPEPADYVELLFNPIERMLAVRPCTKEDPNAIKLVGKNGSPAEFGATCFCSLLFDILDWDEDYVFRIPALMRRKGTEKVLFFDLDNYIGSQVQTKQEETKVPEVAVTEETEEDGKGFFFADDDSYEEVMEDNAEIELKMKEMIEKEKRNYGTPAFEHDSRGRIPMIDDDGEWDIMAEATVIDCDHTVNEEEIIKLKDEMQRRD